VTWRYEDGGPSRLQTVPGGLGISHGSRLDVTFRAAPATTLVVGDGVRTFLLRHTAGEGAVSFVEQIDPITLESFHRSPDLTGGPVWPGGAGVAPDGFIHVVFGNHAHRLDHDLHVVATCQLPRNKPYNSFVPLPDGHLVTKDFGGSRPDLTVAPRDREACELVVLEPVGLDIVARLVLPEASIARLSADDSHVYVVGDTHLLRAEWDGTTLSLDEGFAPRYRVVDGQTYGWDCVIAAGAAWFLDDGDGSERYVGTFRGLGVSSAPLHLVRVDLATAEVTLTEVCGRPMGLVANPPLVDESRGVVIGYDSGNGVMAAFDIPTLGLRWQRSQDHASHFLLYPDTGEVVSNDNSDVVVLDISTGSELARADTGHGMQLVLFPAPGMGCDFYVCSFIGVSHVVVTSD
jgi:hypothetical protein